MNRWKDRRDISDGKDEWASREYKPLYKAIQGYLKQLNILKLAIAT
jgi:hypothetical protein